MRVKNRNKIFNELSEEDIKELKAWGEKRVLEAEALEILFETFPEAENEWLENITL